MAHEQLQQDGIRSWFVNNPKVALLASFILLLAGLLTALSMKTEVFPPFRPGFVTATVDYRGASVQEIHDSVLLPLESAASGLIGVRTTRGYARPSVATLQLELKENASPESVAIELERAIAGLDTLPAGTDAPRVEIDRGGDPLLTVLVSGSAGPSTVRGAAAELRASLLSEVPGVRVELEAEAIERLVDVPLATLRAHNMTVSDIGAALEAVESRTGIGVEEGDGSTRMGEVVAPPRALDLAELASRRVVLGDDLTIPIGEIGTLSERFAGPDSETTLDGLPAVQLHVYNETGDDPPSVSGRIRSVIDAAEIPQGISVLVWADTSGEFAGRLGVVLENGLLGFGLVLLVLGLFVSPRVAIWVAIGLPVVLLGSLAVWGAAGISLNQMTLFALLLVLGIVVDDSIIIGEAIESSQDSGDGTEHGAAGVRDVWMPVVCAVVTNMLAFLPLAFVPGELGTLFGQMAVVVLCVLALSLFESGYLLPAHLSHASVPLPAFAYAPSRAVGRGLRLVSDRALRPVFGFGIRQPLLMLLCSCTLFVAGVGLVANGSVPWRFTPLVAADQVELSYVLPSATSINEARELRAEIEDAAQRAGQELGADVENIRVLVSIGGGSGDPEEESANVPGPHRILASVDVGPSSDRSFSSDAFARAWRSASPLDPSGQRPTVNALALGGSAEEVAFELSHPDPDLLSKAAQTLARSLRANGPVETVDSADPFALTRVVELLPAAPRLGVLNADVSRELNAAFFGYTSDRYAGPDGEYEVRVRVVPTDLSGDMIGLLPVRGSSAQDPVPFGLVAALEPVEASTQLVRRDGRSIQVVVATLDENSPGAEAVEEDLPALLAEEYPGLDVRLAGEAEAEGRALAALARNTALAGLVMFALLVVPLRSFLQPLLLLLVLPIGLAGGVICHAIMGFEFSMVSLLGTVAVCGVLVNDGLILLHTANRYREDGRDPRQAALDAALSRFRPIMLTTITTAAGLAPLIFEPAQQAQFLVPMVLTLGGGLLVASPVVLVLLPGLWALTQPRAAGPVAQEPSAPPSSELHAVST